MQQCEDRSLHGNSCFFDVNFEFGNALLFNSFEYSRLVMMHLQSFSISKDFAFENVLSQCFKFTLIVTVQSRTYNYVSPLMECF